MGAIGTLIPSMALYSESQDKERSTANQKWIDQASDLTQPAKTLIAPF
jgi:hypothetical protein